MKLKFLGTSAAWPLPRLGCDCNVCRSLDSKDSRWRSSLLVNEKILIDAGLDIYHQFQKFNIGLIDAILITHPHPDHFFGLWDLGKIIKPKNHKISLFCTRKARSIMQRCLPAGIEGFDLKIIKFSDNFQLDSLKIYSFGVVHTKTHPETGFRIENNKKSFCYIPDIRALNKETKYHFRHCQVVILDGATLKIPFPVWTKTWGHWSIVEAINLLKEFKNIKKVYFTHIGHRVGCHQETEKWIKSKFGSKYNLAYDGLELIL